MSIATAEAIMAEPTTETAQPSITVDQFLADKRHFFHAFTMFTVGNVVLIALILILMAIFLV
jgi:hypothetical protein